MAGELEELFVREIEIGIANMDVSTDDGVTSMRVVVQRAAAVDRKLGEERQLLLIYDPEQISTVADAFRTAAQRTAITP